MNGVAVRAIIQLVKHMGVIDMFAVANYNVCMRAFKTNYDFLWKWGRKNDRKNTYS